MASVQFVLDGKAVGHPVTSSPYAINWDTTSAANGAHTLTGSCDRHEREHGSSPEVSVTVQNPAGSEACFIMDADVSVHGKGTATTPAFHTGTTGETRLAFVSTDGPKGAYPDPGGSVRRL